MMVKEVSEVATTDESSSLLARTGTVGDGCGETANSCNNSPNDSRPNAVGNKRNKLLFPFLSSPIIFGLLYWLVILPRFETLETNHNLSILNNLTAAAAAAAAAATTKDAFIIPDGCESTLLIVRHCDDLGGGTQRDDGTKHCSHLGKLRSEYLASLFGTRWPVPAALYALSKGLNRRQLETLEPLSARTGVPIQGFEHPGIRELRAAHFRALAAGELCGNLAVAAWKHRYIRDAALAVGCGPDNGCDVGGSGGGSREWDDLDFDSVLEIMFVYRNTTLEGFEDEDNHLGWHVYGTKTHEYFDPVEYERHHGANGKENEAGY